MAEAPDTCKAADTQALMPDTVMDPRMGLSGVGLLEHGQDPADTRTAVSGPRHHLAEEVVGDMETWIVDGHQVTTREGAAEYLQLARNTVNVYASPRGRARHGWPEPVPGLTVDGQEVYLLDDLDAFRANRAPSGPKREGENSATRARMQLADGDPDELIGVTEFAKIRGVTRGTFKRYVEMSLDAWDRGENGYLPRYATREPGAARGFIYQWPRRVAVEWSFPAEPRKASGRKSGVRPTVNDLKAAQVELRPDATLRELAGYMSRLLGVEVSMQVARRLRRQLETQSDDSSQS